MYKGMKKPIACAVIAAMLVLMGMMAGCAEQVVEESTSESTAALYDITYVEYIAMPAEEKQAYMDQFSTIEEKLAFIQWVNAEEEQYLATKP